MSDVFDAMRDTFDALVFDPFPSRKHPDAAYMIGYLLQGKRSDRYKFIYLPARRMRLTRAHKNKHMRHRKRPNGRGRGR